MKDTFTPIELAKELGRSTKTIRTWLTAGVGGVRLRALMVGGRWMIKKEAVDEFLEATTKKAIKAEPVVPESEAARKRRREATLNRLRAKGINI